MTRLPPTSTLFPYTTLFRSLLHHEHHVAEGGDVGASGRRRPEQAAHLRDAPARLHLVVEDLPGAPPAREHRSEEHTSELQSQSNLVCRLLLENKYKLQLELH